MDTFSKVILDIYSAPGSQQGWNKAIHTVNKICGGNNGAYLNINKETMQVEAAFYPDYPADYAQKYIQEAYEKDMRLKYIHKVLPGNAYRDYEYIPDMQEYVESEWLQYQHKEVSDYHSMVGYISKHGLWSDYITLNRSQKSGSFSTDDKNMLLSLMPHLAKIGELSSWINDLEKRYSAVLSVLDNLLVGLIILDTRGSVIVENKVAQQSRETTEAFSISLKKQLRLVDDQTNLDLQQLLINKSSADEKGSNFEGGQVVTKSRIDNSPILLEIMPIRDDGFSDRDNIQGSAVFILDPTQAQHFSSQGLAKIFKLSEAEANITQELVNGTTISDISAQRETHVDTVRGQVKKVFAKTGVNSQLDLMSLAVKATPPIKKPQ